MNGLDAMFLAAETPTMPLQVTAALVVEPWASTSGAIGRRGERTTGAGGDPPFVVVRDLIERRLERVPVLRRRAVAVPFGLDHPVWVDDPDFAVDEHLRRVRLPAPGGPRELAELVADMASRPLDRSRPLWELVVADGLESGHLVVVPKLHHAVADGIMGTDIVAAFLDPEPGHEHLRAPGTHAFDEPEDLDHALGGRSNALSDVGGGWEGEAVPQEHEMLLRSIASMVREPEQFASALVRTSSVVRELVRRNRRWREEEGREPPPAPFSAPPASISATISSQRSFAFTSMPMGDVELARRAFGGTVNDVVLTVVGGALRRFLDDRGEQLERSLVAMVPRSLRAAAPGSDDASPGAGNRLSAMLVSLATTVADPVVRLRIVAEGARLAKDQSGTIPDALVQGWARLAVPAWTTRAFRLASNLRLFERTRPLFNVTVSTVRGPSTSLWLAGGRVEAVYPSGPVADGAGVNVTAISYAGTMFVGVTTCRRLVPDAWALCDHLLEEAGRLVKTARRSGNWCP
jgi:diacylglycerol O-acyltransferase / wax synthase